ncbi:hypothetical protein DFH08DRAFT_820490 [Mycena albidolilacea]|uniref:Uncharacterized protein n=1 Tax=Mycena albidolilacea TaxID=1033008 RepID=A0AAD6ZCS1_9AGAR|nr:hypothetical protein DFH08DRAFT_820490 [Mycena albidolilacea]
MYKYVQQSNPPHLPCLPAGSCLCPSYPASFPPILVPQYPPDLAPYNPYNTPTAQYNFRNNFQATYDRTAAQSAFLPFRIALGDATNTVGAAAAPNPQKRKRVSGTTTNSEANTRRRLKHDSNIDAPAIFGISPSTASATAASAASDTVYHPAITNIPAVNLGSLLDKSDKRAHMAAKPDSLPVENSISSTRPDRKKLFSLAFVDFLLLTSMLGAEDWTTRKNAQGRQPSFGITSNPSMESEKLKGWDNLGTSGSNKNSPSGERKEFTLPSF